MRQPEERPATRTQRLARYRDARARASPRLSRATFERLVAEALDTLPTYVQQRIENVAVLVEEWPDPERVKETGHDPRYGLLGLYEGINLAERGGGYHLVTPDRITLYRQPILKQVGSGGRDAIVREIRATVIHEFGHHFGLTDAEIEAIEREGEQQLHR